MVTLEDLPDRPVATPLVGLAKTWMARTAILKVLQYQHAFGYSFEIYG